MIIKKTKRLTFARFGGLSSVKQKGYEASSDRFHSPPARRGVYCFVYPYIERFLLGGREVGDMHAKFSWLKDKMGEKINSETSETKFSGKKYWTFKDPKQEGVWFYAIPKSMKTFTYEGPLWHHLGEHCPSEEILARKGEWVKTSTLTHAKAFFKELHKLNLDNKRSLFQDDYGMRRDSKQKNSDPNQYVSYRICLDHLEVFIEKI